MEDDMVVVGHSSSESQDGDDGTNENGSLEVLRNDMSIINAVQEDNDDDNERKDITQALEVVGRVKDTIQFHDEAFQQALEKVKERPLIDAAFVEKIEMLQRLKDTESYANFHGVIDEALVQLADVQEKAKNGKTSLNRPIEVLNEVLPVFEKACSVFTEKVELSDTVNRNLNKCDAIRMQIKQCLEMDRQDVDEAKRLEKDCEKLLDEAVKGGKQDVEKVLEKIKEEEEANILKWFKDTREENGDKMDFLTSDFEQMKENCAEDIQLTERTLQIEIESKDEAFEDFKRKDKELEEKIDEDIATEEELKEELRKVQEHRRLLEEDREIRKKKQERADVVHEKAEEDLQLLLDNLKNLLSKVDTANVVLRQTRDVCSVLFNKAVESKSTKNQDLQNLLVQSQSLRHVALIAQAVHCKNNVEQHKGTVSYLNEKIDKRKKKLQDALRRKLAKEVKEHQEKLKNLSSDLEGCRKVLQKSDDKLKLLTNQINEIEQELDDAGSEYETLDNAFDRFKKQEEGNDGYSLSSLS